MQEFIEKAAGIGVIITDIVADSKCQRVPTDNNTGHKNGWYFATEINGRLFATVGNWETGEQVKYPGNGVEKSLPSADIAILAILRNDAKKKQKERNLLASVMAEDIYSKAHKKTHRYLDNKQIKAHSARVSGDELLIPIYDQAGCLSTLQRISPDGTKKLYHGGKKKGCCHIIEGDSETVYICEGFATGATINELTGNKVLVAIDAGNMPSVSSFAITMFGNIVIASDNDHKKEKNVGLQAGKKVAESFGLTHVYPEGIDGSDFNDMFCELGRDKTLATLQPGRIQLMTADDISSSNMSTVIPSTPGLIGLGMEALSEPGMPGIDQYSFATVVTALAGALAGKITCQGVWPNLYNVKVGPTSSGKSVADKEMRIAIKEAGLKGFYGMTDIASGAAIYRGLAENPQTVLIIDEITKLFRRYSKADPLSDDKRDALLEIYSNSGQDISKMYGNAKNSINISEPCLTVSGNATPLIFDSFSVDDFASGMIQRVDFFVFDGEIPRRGIRPNSGNTKLTQFVEGIAGIVNSMPTSGNLAGLSATSVGLSIDASDLLTDYSNKVVSRTNGAEESGGCRGIISRQYDLAIKYAMLHMASTRPAAMLYDNMETTDLEWGICVAESLCGWKIGALQGKIVSGDFHKDCKTFIDAIKATIKMGKRPTFKTMTNRRKELNNWKRNHSEEVISVLLKRGDIVIDETGRKTAYQLPK